MSVDKMPLFKTFPAEEGQLKLVKWIKDKIYAIVSYRINWMLNRVLSEGFEFIVEGNEPGDNGNWIITISTDDLVVQKRVSGSLTTVWTFAGS